MTDDTTAPDEEYDYYSRPENQQAQGTPRRRSTRLTAPIPVRPPELLEEIRQRAGEDDRSVSSWIRRAVEHELQRPTQSQSVEFPYWLKRAFGASGRGPALRAALACHPRAPRPVTYDADPVQRSADPFGGRIGRSEPHPIQWGPSMARAPVSDPEANAGVIACQLVTVCGAPHL